MQNMVHQDISALVIEDVSKIYVQWQRSGKIKDIVKNQFEIYHRRFLMKS